MGAYHQPSTIRLIVTTKLTIEARFLYDKEQGEIEESEFKDTTNLLLYDWMLIRNKLLFPPFFFIFPFRIWEETKINNGVIKYWILLEMI